jgi:ribosomal protein L25 (general stress protein Ctc)
MIYGSYRFALILFFIILQCSLFWVKGLSDLRAMRREWDKMAQVYSYKTKGTHIELKLQILHALSPKVGKGRYAMAEYEKLKRITIPLDDDSHLLLITTEVDADHDKIIDKVLKSVQHSSDDYMSDA